METTHLAQFLMARFEVDSIQAADFELVQLAQVPEPTAVAQVPGDPLRLFVLDRNGPVHVLQLDQADGSFELLTTPFLDLSKLPGGLHKGVEADPFKQRQP